MATRPNERRARFEAEVVPHLAVAYRVALALTHQEADAEDLVQESVLHAYRGFTGFHRGTNARAWLLTIVRHTFFNLRRQAKSRPQVVPFTAVGEQGSSAEPMDTTLGPEERALQHLERERLLRALAGVPEPYRTVVALVDLGELRYTEAAEVLGCPRGTVMSRLHRGRLLLAERLGMRAQPDAAGHHAVPAVRRAGGTR